ncbi:MAG: phenylalanine--tRNA ligase subunit beta [Acidobacteria bacterium]|nr:phenylalanine--tRNA ligase subunit beta [Acidobacteriota bacterium]
MRLLVSWLKDFVDVPGSADEIAGTLGLRGFEVAGIEPAGPGDAVIDVEVTANRPDCLSVIGLAREIATAYGLPLRTPAADPDAAIALAAAPAGGADRVQVIDEDAALCPRYAAAVAEVIPVATPAWMAGRLQAAGIRPISAIVDLTNYVNVELGQPMHAFDLARLAGGTIRIRRARPGETIRTLDGVARTLEADMLVIADADRAQAIAGVMGGADSEVTGSTREVVFESACFDPASVRRTSRRLQLKTEASIRFERGSDPGAPVMALRRAIALMQQMCAGRLSGPIVDRYPSPRERRRLRLRRARVKLLLGATPPDAEIVRILEGLGLEVAAAGGGWDVAAPTFRVDLLREADLIEEVGRHYGLDRIEPTFPPAMTPTPPPDPRIARDRLVRRLLTAAGLSEAVSFGFIEARAAAAFAPDGGPDAVSIANPLSAKFDTLRASLVPGLVDALAHNRRHGLRDVRLFEIGARFAASGETRGVAVAWTGNAGSEHWSGGGRDVDFFDVKGLVEQICAALGAEIRCVPAATPFLVAGQTAAILGPQGQAIGLLGVVAPAAADRRGLPRQDRVVVGELNLDALDAIGVPAADRTRPLPRHPAVVRDLSIIVPDALPAATIRGTMQAAAADLKAPLAGTALFDRYQGQGVPEASVSLSIRLTFQAPDRTLTDAEVQQSVEQILAALVREHGAVRR